MAPPTFVIGADDAQRWIRNNVTVDRTNPSWENDWTNIELQHGLAITGSNGTLRGVGSSDHGIGAAIDFHTRDSRTGSIWSNEGRWLTDNALYFGFERYNVNAAGYATFHFNYIK